MNTELFQALRELMVITWIIVLYFSKIKFKSKTVFVFTLFLGVLFIWFFRFEQLPRRYNTLEQAHSVFKASMEIEDKGRVEKAIIGSDTAVFCYEMEDFIPVSNYPPYFNNGRGWKTAQSLSTRSVMPGYCIAHSITVPESKERIIIIVKWNTAQILGAFEVSDTIGTEFEPLFFDEVGCQWQSNFVQKGRLKFVQKREKGKPIYQVSRGVRERVEIFCGAKNTTRP